MADARGLGNPVILARSTDPPVTSIDRGTAVRGTAQLPTKPVEALELHPEDSQPWVSVRTKGGSTYKLGWVSGIPDAVTLPAGPYRADIKRTRWELAWSGAARSMPVPTYALTEFRNLPQALGASIEITSGLVPAQVVREVRTTKAASAAPTRGGGPAFPVRPDHEALARSQELRNFVWQLLGHFLKAPEVQKRSVTIQDIDSFAARSPAATGVVSRVTQAWSEMRRTADPTLTRFRHMGELIAEQYVFGNETIMDNALEVRAEPSGLGLYHRANALKYYDEYGLPALDVMRTGRRDVYYAPTQRMVFRYAPATRDWATLKLLQTMGGDTEIVALVEGLWANLDLFVSHLRGTGRLDRMLQSLRQQAAAVALFFSAECACVLLERFGSAREKVAAKLIHAGLVVTGRLFQIRFAFNLKEVMFQIGHHLYRVKRRSDGSLDELSRVHLDQAADLARPVLEELAALGLVMGAFKVASVTAPLLDPPGGPGSLMFVPATVGSGAATARTAGAPGSSTPQPEFVVLMGGVGTKGGSKVAESEAGKTEKETADKKARSPKELEEQLLGPDQQPDTPRYLSRRNKALRTTLKELLAHIRDPKNQQFYRNAGTKPPNVKPEVLDVKTQDFLRRPENKRLNTTYQKLLNDAAERVANLSKRRNVNVQEERQADELYEAILDFGAGKLSSKRPDKVEFFIDRGEFATTDPSFEWYEPFHNFKHAVYVQAIKAATGMKGAGIELETLEKSRLIETKK